MRGIHSRTLIRYKKHPVIDITTQTPTIPAAEVLLARYQAVRHLTLDICQPLKAEDFVVQPVVDVSPPKWHLGHTTWFFETFVLSQYKKYDVFDEDYGFLFNSYYESVGKRVLRVNRGLMTRPTIEEVMEYRHYVDKQMEAFLTCGHVPEDLLPVIELGLQHEQQHQELLLYDIKYILGHNPLFPSYRKNDASRDQSSPVTLDFLPFSEGLYEIGYDGSQFHFDNEEGVHKTYLHEFAIANRLVTNAEYIEFIKDGGYNDFRYWLSEGWDWVKNSKIKAPHYWYHIDGVWHNYTLQDVLYQFVIGYDEIRSIDRASSWLFRVARNKIIDSFRKKKPQAFTDMAPSIGEDEQPLMLEDILPDIQNLPEKELIRDMVWARIDQALNDLPAKQRQVFILHEFEHKSFKEIQEITSDSLNTLLSRKRYAVLALRVALQDLYDEMKND